MKTLYRLLGIGGNCLNCNFELAGDRGVSYLIDPPVEPYLFAAQNGALCGECALQLLTDGDEFTTEEEVVVLIRTL